MSLNKFHNILFCAKCGTNIQGQQNFCPTCGRSVRRIISSSKDSETTLDIETIESGSHAAKLYENSYLAAQYKPFGLSWNFISILLAVFTVIVVLCFFLISNNRSPKQAGQMQNNVAATNTLADDYSDNFSIDDPELIRQRNVERKYKYLRGDSWSDFNPILVVNTDKANFYDSTDEYSINNAYCIQGDKVAVEENLSDWVLVSFFNGTITTKGYMKKEDLTKDTTLTEEHYGNAISIVEGLRVRLKPGMNEPVVDVLSKGEQSSYVGFKTNYSTPATVKDKEFSDPWYYVRIKDEIKGWVHGCCVEINIDNTEGE